MLYGTEKNKPMGISHDRMLKNKKQRKKEILTGAGELLIPIDTQLKNRKKKQIPRITSTYLPHKTPALLTDVVGHKNPYVFHVGAQRVTKKKRL